MKKTLLIFNFLILGLVVHAQNLIHYWNFNDNTDSLVLLTPSFSEITGAGIEHILGGSSLIEFPGTGQGFSDLNLNARFGDTAGTHLRFNNPIGGALIFSLPSTGYKNLSLSFATRRSGSGAGVQYWSYSSDGISYTLFDSIFPSSVGPELKTLNLSSIESANDNPNFKLKVEFAQGPGSTEGNNRWDNMAFEGNPLAELIHYWDFNDNTDLITLLSPTYAQVTGSGISHIEGGASVIQFPGTGQDFELANVNAKRGSVAGSHLRFNNPIGGILEFKIPSTGFENIVVKMATRRSGSGAGTQYWHYTTNGSDFVLFDSIFPVDGAPELKMLDLRNIAGTGNNDSLKLRVSFAQGSGGTVGNNRFDNFSVESMAPDLTGKVTGINLLPKQAVLNEGEQVQLTAQVSPADATDTTVAWWSGNVAIATVDSAGLISAIAEGTTYIYVSSNDGGFTDSCELFVNKPSELDLIYYWHFNNFFPTEDVTVIEADYNWLSTYKAKFTYTDPIPGERDIDRFSPGSLINIQRGEATGGSARVRNPSVNRSLVFDVPTNGVTDVQMTYAVQRSGSGMLWNIIEYTTDGVTYTNAGLTVDRREVIGDEEWQEFSFDFSGITAVNNNPAFKIRITWEGNNIASNGNNRYDNITIMGNGDETKASLDLKIGELVKVYPNPSKDKVYVLIPEGEKMYSVSIVDASGRKLYEGSDAEINTACLNQGIYFVVTTLESGTYLNRIVVSH